MVIFEYIGIFCNLIKYYRSCTKYYNKVTIHYVTGTREFTVYTNYNDVLLSQQVT